MLLPTQHEASHRPSVTQATNFRPCLEGAARHVKVSLDKPYQTRRVAGGMVEEEDREKGKRGGGVRVELDEGCSCVCHVADHRKQNGILRQPKCKGGNSMDTPRACVGAREKGRGLALSLEPRDRYARE